MFRRQDLLRILRTGQGAENDRFAEEESAAGDLASHRMEKEGMGEAD